MVTYEAYADPIDYCHLSIAVTPCRRINEVMYCSPGAKICRSNPPSTFVQGVILEGHRLFITHLVATSCALRHF